MTAMLSLVVASLIGMVADASDAAEGAQHLGSANRFGIPGICQLRTCSKTLAFLICGMYQCINGSCLIFLSGWSIMVCVPML